MITTTTIVMTLVTLVLVITLAPAITTASKIPRWSMKIAQQQGPNACVVEEVPGTKHRYYTDCKYWKNREICGQKSMIRYECCEGFQQVPGQQGCTGVKPLKNVLETARDLGAGKFVRYLEKSGMAPELTRAGAITLFAPLDEAFDDMTREQRQRLDNFQYPTQNPLLLYHLSDRKITSKQFGANLVVDTRYNGHQLRINKFSSGIATVNCAGIVRKDQQATNGVVHIVNAVLDPMDASSLDLPELIVQDGRFTELAKAMEQSGFANRLRQSHQTCTFLAPSDEAFQKISSSRLQRILADKEAREALLENHVIPHPMCLAAIQGEHKVRTLDSGHLTFDCDRKGTTVEGKRLRSDFIMGQNGAVYMMDDLLLPDRAKSILQLAEEEKLFTFRQLVATADLEDALENYSEYTLFVPSEAAMYSLPQNTLVELRSNKEKARNFVMFHATQGRITSDQITDNQAVMSLDETNPLRLQVYRRALGVEDAIIEKADIEGMNGCIHVINKVLTPTSVSAGDVLRRDGNFSIFLQAMERVMERTPDKLELPKDGSFTFFVPTDQAFTRLGAERLERIMDDTSYLAKTIRNHVVDDMLASEAFKPDLFYDVQTRQNTVDVVRKNGKLKVNDATMVTCDILNTEGVIHVINKVLLPDRHMDG